MCGGARDGGTAYAVSLELAPGRFQGKTAQCWILFSFSRVNCCLSSSDARWHDACAMLHACICRRDWVPQLSRSRAVVAQPARTPTPNDILLGYSFQLNCSLYSLQS